MTAELPGSIARAQALTEVGRHADARAELRRHLALAPESVDALCLLAMCELELREYSAALRAADAAVAVAPYLDWALRLRALALSKLGRHAEAEEAALAAVRLDPEDFANHHTVAHVLHDFTNGRRLMPAELMRARNAALRSVELAPNEPAAHLISGLTAGAVGQRDVERACYEEALRLDPSNAMAMNNLAAMDADRARLGSAAKRIVAGLRMDPQEEMLRRNLDGIALRLIRRVFNVMLLSGVLIFVVFAVSEGAWLPRAVVGVLSICGYALVAWLTLRHLPQGARRHLRGLFRRMTTGQRLMSIGAAVFGTGILITCFVPGDAAFVGVVVMGVIIRVAQVLFVVWLLSLVVRGASRALRR